MKQVVAFLGDVIRTEVLGIKQAAHGKEDIQQQSLPMYHNIFVC
jgi:hypothetical protein